MEINNLKELIEYGILKKGDRVIFHLHNEVVECLVRDIGSLATDSHSIFLDNLSDSSSSNNDYIFCVLNLNKYEIASEEYGYKTDQGYWPYAKKNDFEAVTRVVKRLYKEMGETEVEEDEIKTSRFSLIDLD